MAAIKGSKVVDGKATKAENDAYARFFKQPCFAFVSTDERVEDAFRTGFRAAHALWQRKEDARKKRLEAKR
jgi:hypothetical protein